MWPAGRSMADPDRIDDVDDVLQLLARRRRELTVDVYGEDRDLAYLTARVGVAAGLVPDYRVCVGPEGEFVAVPRGGGEELTPVERALVAGDCARRFLLGTMAKDGTDPFADVRHGTWVGSWPGDMSLQKRFYPCWQCGQISDHPGDVADRYCGHCHDQTDNPHRPRTVGAPGHLLRLEESTVDGSPAAWWQPTWWHDQWDGAGQQPDGGRLC
jgi:hypothetical protein